jgi:hypothetical protein
VPVVRSRLNAQKRLLAAFVIFATGAVLLPGSFPNAVRLAMAWDGGVLLFLGLTA